jgi:hypothetical protein
VYLSNILLPNYLETVRMSPMGRIVPESQLKSFDLMNIKLSLSVFLGSGT